MCECVSITPGVTHLPVASITTASVGGTMFVPTAAILPSRNNTEPRSIIGPVAVRTLAFVMSVGRDGSARYDDGNGSDGGAGAGVVVCGAAAGRALLHPASRTPRAMSRGTRMTRLRV